MVCAHTRHLLNVYTHTRQLTLPLYSQLDEANALLRTESDTAARLRKTQNEMSKQIQQLETNNRELQDKTCMLENAKLKLEKDYINLQSALESEKRDKTQGSEIISDLQGRDIHCLKYSLLLQLSYKLRSML